MITHASAHVAIRRPGAGSLLPFYMASGIQTQVVRPAH